MTPPRRNLLTRAVDLVRAASNADSFDVAAIRAALIRLGAQFVDGQTNTMKLSGVTAALDFDNGEQLILRWAANARAALAESDEAIPFVSAFTEIEAGDRTPPIIATSGYAEMLDLPTEEEE